MIISSAIVFLIAITLHTFGKKGFCAITAFITLVV